MASRRHMSVRDNRLAGHVFAVCWELSKFGWMGAIKFVRKT
jgi:hypothetical protein